jgi:hypothetical protein
MAKRNRRSRHFCRENLQLNAERPASRRFSKKLNIYSTAEGTGMNKCVRASNETRKDSSLTKRETKQHCSILGEQPLELVEALLLFTSMGTSLASFPVAMSTRKSLMCDRFIRTATHAPILTLHFAGRRVTTHDALCSALYCFSVRSLLISI